VRWADTRRFVELSTGGRGPAGAWAPASGAAPAGPVVGARAVARLWAGRAPTLAAAVSRRQRMTREELLEQLAQETRTAVASHLCALPTITVASVDSMEKLARDCLDRVRREVLDAWVDHLELVARKLAGVCPRCGRPRRYKRRAEAPMRIVLLGAEVKVPKPYLECGHCGAPGISILRILTGLGDGAATGELELAAAYCSSQHSYGKAAFDLAVHHGQTVERTSVRRMSLAVEVFAMTWVETQRQAALARVSGEARVAGEAQLMLQGDGGTVRTGHLAPCVRGDPGYGKKSAKRHLPRRKRIAEKREVITMDVRVPGTVTTAAMDVMVPILSPQGERERRMLALASRAGLGENTQMLGLGDLGSGLPQAFDEAFTGYDATYSGDWHHQRNYVHEATSVLTGLDSSRWERQMRHAIWQRDERRRDALLKKAAEHRVPTLPAHLERCPVKALKTYLINNWEYLRSAEFKALGVDYVSARAEAQVRDRTKRRFAVPGAWCVQNLEPKATLRAIIADGRWESFRAAYLEQREKRFVRELAQRLDMTLARGSLDPVAVAPLREQLARAEQARQPEEARKAA
jgi:hypothetical protein